MRDNRLASRILAKSLNPIEGGSDSRTPEATGKLQILQQFSVSSVKDGREQNQATKAKSMYVGMQTQTCRVEDSSKKENNDKKEEKDKKGQSTARSKQNKFSRSVDDGRFWWFQLGSMDNVSTH